MARWILLAVALPCRPTEPVRNLQPDPSPPSSFQTAHFGIRSPVKVEAPATDKLLASPASSAAVRQNILYAPEGRRS